MATACAIHVHRCAQPLPYTYRGHLSVMDEHILPKELGQIPLHSLYAPRPAAWGMLWCQWELPRERSNVLTLNYGERAHSARQALAKQ